MPKIQLTKKQLNVVREACELYCRIAMGQFDAILNLGIHKPKDIQTAYEALKEARRHLCPENLGIMQEGVSEEARIARDIRQKISREFWLADPNRSSLDVAGDAFFVSKDHHKIKVEF